MWKNKDCIGCEERRKTNLKKTNPAKYEKEILREATETETTVIVIKKIVSIGWKVYTLWQSLNIPKERLSKLKWLVE
jgi:hypothetical protein